LWERKYVYVAAPGRYVNSEILKLSYQQGYVWVGTGKEWLKAAHQVMSELA